MRHAFAAHARVGARLAPLGALLVLVVGGCRAYERRPLDLAGHHAAFLARTPASPEVGAFAARLAAESAGTREFNPADGITCAEAEVIALVFNAELRLARLRAGVARATAEHAGLWEDPTIGVDLARVLGGTPEPWKVFSSVGVTIPISGRLAIEQRRAGIEHAAEVARVAQREWSVRMEVRRAWCDWSALDARAATTREFIERVDQVLTIVEMLERAGEMSRAEARLFRIERATRAVELAGLESNAHETDLRLRRLMGLSPDAPVRLVARGIGPSPDWARAGGTVDPEVLARRSPGMLVAIAEHEGAEAALELEIRRQYPDLHVGPGFGREDGQDQVLLGLSLPVPILNANRRGIAEADARREVARGVAETTLEQVLADARAAEARRDGADRRREVLEREIVPLVDAQYADAREVARLGEVNALVLLESLTRQLEAKVALIAARRDEALAAIDLDELLGPAPVLPPDAPRTDTPADTPAHAPAHTSHAAD